jgi:hypothetical protein
MFYCSWEEAKSFVNFFLDCVNIVSKNKKGEMITINFTKDNKIYYKMTTSRIKMTTKKMRTKVMILKK